MLALTRVPFIVVVNRAPETFAADAVDAHPMAPARRRAVTRLELRACFIGVSAEKRRDEWRWGKAKTPASSSNPHSYGRVSFSAEFGRMRPDRDENIAVSPVLSRHARRDWGKAR